VKNKTICDVILRCLTLGDLLSSMKKFKTIENEERITSMVLLPNGNLATITNAGVNILETNSYKCIETINIAFTESILVIKNNIMATSHSSYIKLWDIDNNYICIKTFTSKDYSCFGKLLLLQNGMILCTATSGQQLFSSSYIVIFDSNLDNVIYTFKHSYITAIVTLPNNQLACATDVIEILDINNNYKCIKTLLADSNCLLYIKHKNYLLSGAFEISVWDISDNYRLTRSFKAHDDEICCFLLISCRYFASGSCDNTMRLWDVDNFNCINVLEGHPKSICSLALLNGYRIISSSKDKSLIVWSYKE
jgi:WD40 repeat protein